MIKVKNALETRAKVLDNESSLPFERSFIRSITTDRNVYIQSNTFGNNILDMSYMKQNLSLSTKQEKIYLDIEFKYNNKSVANDLFEKYTKIFKEKGIVLDSFDLRHLETFKGIMIESDNFKKWVYKLLPTT